MTVLTYGVARDLTGRAHACRSESPLETVCGIEPLSVLLQADAVWPADGPQCNACETGMI